MSEGGDELRSTQTAPDILWGGKTNNKPQSRAICSDSSFAPPSLFQTVKLIVPSTPRQHLHVSGDVKGKAHRFTFYGKLCARSRLSGNLRSKFRTVRTFLGRDDRNMTALQSSQFIATPSSFARNSGASILIHSKTPSFLCCMAALHRLNVLAGHLQPSADISSLSIVETCVSLFSLTTCILNLSLCNAMQARTDGRLWHDNCGGLSMKVGHARITGLIYGSASCNAYHQI